MSLILEALRKSEAERRRAHMPDLLTEAPVAAPVALRAPQRWPWIAAGAAVLLAAAWVATRDATPAAAPIPPAAPIETAASTTGDIAPAPAPARPAPAVRRPLVIAPPVTRAPSKPVAVAPAPPNPAATLREPPIPERIHTAPTHTAPVAAEPAPAPGFDPTERITDLGSDDRKQLPPLKLSMHMWNDAASQRFVIIDGTRLGVGDRLGAVVVADILPDGVLLDWNGRALKLPLR